MRRKTNNSFNIDFVLAVKYNAIWSVSLFNLLCQSRPEKQASCLPYSGERPPWRSQMQCYIFPGLCEELKMAAT